MELVWFVPLLLLVWAVEVPGEAHQDLLSATELELLKSQLWKENVANLFIVKQSELLDISSSQLQNNNLCPIDANPIPAEIMGYVKVELPATIVEVCCCARYFSTVCSSARCRFPVKLQTVAVSAACCPSTRLLLREEVGKGVWSVLTHGRSLAINWITSSES